MKVQLMGAAQTVTGSCYIIETEKVRFAVDCGLHQGSAGLEKRNFETDPYDSPSLDFILLTHAHIDHSGLLPRLVKSGFTGPVYCTEPTKALLEIMLLDSAHIQEMEAEWESRKKARQGHDPVEPLYTTEEAIQATKLFKEVLYNTEFTPGEGVQAVYRDAGHILGSAFFELTITEKAGQTRLIFSGDLGRCNALLVDDPASPEIKADYLFLESTYGDRNHKNVDSSREELAEAIWYSYNNGEKAIIPAFAVERTQEIVYSLFLLNKENKLPPDIPIFVDSPLAVRATEVFKEHPAYFDKETIQLIENGEDPLSLPNLQYIKNVEDSKKINEMRGPGIIISASGMCNAGRIKHHLRHNLWRPGASIIFTGYQSVGTPGRRLVDGAKTLNILGEIISVEAKIFTIGGFSGHAGQTQLINWVGQFARSDLNVVLVHGEEKAQAVLGGLLKEKYNVPIIIPNYLETLVLVPGKPTEHTPYASEKAVSQNARGINWDFLRDELEAKVAQVSTKLQTVGARPWEEQSDIRQQVEDIQVRMLHLLSQL